MGINESLDARAHRLCCPPHLPIHIRWDHLGDELRTARLRGRKFSYDTNGRGDHLFNFWGLMIEIRPRDIMSKADRDRYKPFWTKRWYKILKAEGLGHLLKGR